MSTKIRSCLLSMLKARWIVRCAAAALIAALAGCMVGPDFLPPDPRLPVGTYNGEPAPIESWLLKPPDPNWWAVFHDPILTGLECRVAAENLDVQTATIRLLESRFERGVTASALFPGVNGDAQYQRELYSVNGPFASPAGPFGPLARTIGSLIAPARIPAIPVPFNEYYIGLDMSWELDLWGHVRRQVEAADAEIGQAAEQRRGALVSSLAELARDYIQLRGTQMQIRIANENLVVAADVLTRAQERAVKGVGYGVDVENAAAQVENIRAQIPQLEQQESQYVNAVSLLLNQPPGALRGELGLPRLVPLTPPRVPTGVPAELARRRPDIRAAEAALHAATAQIGVAVAAFYPTVQLNGTAGFDSLLSNKLWQYSSIQYMAGPSMTVPLFAGGRLINTLELRKAQQQEAAIQYQQTVMRAWHEVVNAIDAYRFEQQRRTSLQLQADHARQALILARERYTDGVGDFLTVLDAERTLLQAGQQYVTSTTNMALDLVLLFKALGGGWEQIFPN